MIMTIKSITFKLAGAYWQGLLINRGREVKHLVFDIDGKHPCKTALINNHGVWFNGNLYDDFEIISCH